VKAKLLRDMMGHDGTDHVAVETTDHQGRRHKHVVARHRSSKRPAGTVIDHPDAHMLVRQGCAVPADDECARAVADMTPERTAAAQAHYEMVAKGIHPDDYEAYQAGAMVGYTPEGDWQPGPNFEAWTAEHAPAAATEEDDQPAPPDVILAAAEPPAIIMPPS
jgi:hypothetical protein